MSDVDTEPRYFKHNNLNLKADNYKDEYFEQVYKLFQDSKTDSTGFLRNLVFRSPEVPDLLFRTVIT